jgi:protein gp37
MAESAIEWTDATWNPVAGCTILSPGCTNCYAMRMAARLDAMGVNKYAGLTRRSGGRSVWTGKVALDNEALNVPLSWRKPRMVFVNSMSDLFQERVPADFVEKVWSVMERTPWHTYQILTKRPERMASESQRLKLLPNVWLGTSVEGREQLPRLEELRTTRAAVRFVSFEPLLTSVAGVNLRGVHWAIVGGESGPRARPMELEWVEEIRTACRRLNTAFFFKQWGGTRKDLTGRVLHGRTWDEFPSRAIAEYGAR